MLPPMRMRLLIPLACLGVEGWTQGKVGAGTETTLAPVDPVRIELPESITSQVVTTTAVFYFSPT